ncbi:MAG: glycosyltransferase family 39 protein [Anaerolineales bacterium]|nr:MAG: glycosyltransferase family 39 protein [Anaerolineales bacterium]
MELLKNIADKLWDKSLIIAGVLCALLPTSPLNMPLTFRDSGVFLYFGWRILNGELPYRDIWDHKPPVIFYINALGLALTDNSRWGVWIIELVALSIAAWIGFQLVKSLFGLSPAISSLLLWLLSLVPLLQGGNFTTEYTLPLQFAALWLAYHINASRRSNWMYFLLGLTGAITFFTKQTAVGIWIAIVLYLTIQRLFTKQIRQWFHEIVIIAFGGLAFTTFVIVFFYIQGALPQFWSAAFEYNFVYSTRIDGGLATALDTISKGVRPLTRTGLLQFSILGFIVAIALILLRKKSAKDTLPLLAIGLVDLPIELYLIGMPSRTFPHYYMTMLPVLALFAGLALWAFIKLMANWHIPNIATGILILGMASYLTWNSFYIYMDQLYTYRKLTKNETIIEYIKETTSPDDTVLLWGAEASVNYFAERKSPTRFVYQYPLHQTGYVNDEMINEFLDDIIKKSPELIIDTGTQNPLYGFPISTDAIIKKIEYLKTHYCQVQRIDTWTIYQFSENGCEY